MLLGEFLEHSTLFYKDFWQIFWKELSFHKRDMLTSPTHRVVPNAKHLFAFLY